MPVIPLALGILSLSLILRLNCLFMPFGTVLGVLTIIVLMRPSVKALFYPTEDLVFSV